MMMSKRRRQASAKPQTSPQPERASTSRCSTAPNDPDSPQVSGGPRNPMSLTPSSRRSKGSASSPMQGPHGQPVKDDFIKLYYRNVKRFAADAPSNKTSPPRQLTPTKQPRIASPKPKRDKTRNLTEVLWQDLGGSQDPTEAPKTLSQVVRAESDFDFLKLPEAPSPVQPSDEPERPAPTAFDNPKTPEKIRRRHAHITPVKTPPAPRQQSQQPGSSTITNIPHQPTTQTSPIAPLIIDMTSKTPTLEQIDVSMQEPSVEEDDEEQFDSDDDFTKLATQALRSKITPVRRRLPLNSDESFSTDQSPEVIRQPAPTNPNQSLGTQSKSFNDTSVSAANQDDDLFDDDFNDGLIKQIYSQVVMKQANPNEKPIDQVDSGQPTGDESDEGVGSSVSDSHTRSPNSKINPLNNTIDGGSEESFDDQLTNFLGNLTKSNPSTPAPRTAAHDESEEQFDDNEIEIIQTVYRGTQSQSSGFAQLENPHPSSEQQLSDGEERFDDDSLEEKFNESTVLRMLNSSRDQIAQLTISANQTTGEEADDEFEEEFDDGFNQVLTELKKKK